MINEKKKKKKQGKGVREIYIVSACTYSPELKFSTSITMHGMT